VRADVQRCDPLPIIEGVHAAGLQCLPIIRDPLVLDVIPIGMDVEIGNEPDLAHEGWTRDSYWDAVDKAIDISAGRHRLWVGCPSNLNSRGFRWLQSLPWGGWPEVGCSVHRYPGAGGPTQGHLRDAPWGWFGKRYTRDEEVERLKSIVGDRPLALTEIGYNADEWDEEQQAMFMDWERAFWKKHGFEIAIAYQINSSATETYGFRNADGTWRQMTEAWTA
jgi:hypothetical protein